MIKQHSVIKIIALYLIAIIFVAFNLTSIKIPAISTVFPMLDFMMVFYFAIFCQRFGIWFIFLLGIWNDALTGNALGVTSLCYILLVKFFLTINQKMLIRENFIQIWQQFIAFCFVIIATKWALLSLLDGTMHSLIVPSSQFLLAVFLYVPMHKLFDILNDKLLQGD
ncbi:MAG: rod shape-determining protein MreD [Alphaproteobacteria bacterium]